MIQIFFLDRIFFRIGFFLDWIFFRIGFFLFGLFFSLLISRYHDPKTNLTDLLMLDFIVLVPSTVVRAGNVCGLKELAIMSYISEWRYWRICRQNHHQLPRHLRLFSSRATFDRHFEFQICKKKKKFPNQWKEIWLLFFVCHFFWNKIRVLPKWWNVKTIKNFSNNFLGAFVVCSWNKMRFGFVFVFVYLLQMIGTFADEQAVQISSNQACDPAKCTLTKSWNVQSFCSLTKNTCYENKLCPFSDGLFR